MNASDGLRMSAWKYAEKTAAVFFEKRCTYAELDQRVNRLANGLLERGFKRGDKIAYMLYNSMEGLEIIQALLRAGITLVPINYRLSPDHMEYIINHCDASCLFLGADLLDSVKPMMPNLVKIPRENYIIIGDKATRGMSKYENVLSRSDENPEADIRPTDIAYVAYTSGTTGLPKGVVTSSRGLMNNMKNALMRGYGRAEIHPEERTLLVLMPLVHSNSIWSTTITFWYGGVNVVYRSGGFDAEEILQIMDREKVTTSSVVPYMLAKVLELPEEVRSKYDVSTVTSIGSGSAMLYQSVIDKMFTYFQGIRLSNSYGSSETGPATTLRYQELGKKPGSIGRPIPGVEVKVLDKEGKELPPGEVGEIWIKSDIAFDGYYKDPEKTTRSKRGDWAWAGDLGYTDEEGYFYLADRGDDIIVSAGEHIAPAEVENVIAGYPKVEEVAVIGVPHAKWGQRVTACVKLKDGVVCTEEEIIGFCKETLPGFKVPKACDFVTEFPTTLTGKILKRVLREEYKKKAR
ncbi:MAG: class I adenylate-forming enzyme family protein, partial [Dehalococcoidia bacterium]